MPKIQNVPTVRQLGRAVASNPTRGTIQLIAGQGCFMLSGYLISVILARGLGPVEYGVYGVTLSVLGWIEMVASAGIPGATAKLISQHESKAPQVEETAIVLLLMVSLMLFLSCWFFAPAFARLFDIPTGRQLFRLAILDIPISGMYLAYQGILYGHQRFGTLSRGLIVYSLTKLVGTLILYILGLSVSGALVVNVLATTGVMVYLALKFPLAGFQPSYALLGPMLHIALPMGLYLIALQVLLNLDLWSLKSLWLGGGEVIGLYVAALNVAKLPVVVPSVLSGVLFASLSWALARRDEAMARRYIHGAARFALVILLPSCTLLALHAEAAMMFLYSDVYAAAGLYLSLQLIAFGLLVFLDIFLHALMAAGKHYQSAGILLALIPVASLFNLVFIPQFGAIGAATSLVLTIFLGTTIATICTYQRFGSLIPLSTLVRVSMATGFIVLISSKISIEGPWLILKLIVLIGVYTLLLIILKELSRQDLKALALWQKGTTLNGATTT